jgi:hypothetical protein
MGAEDTTQKLPDDQVHQIIVELRSQFGQLTTRLDSFENKVDARLKETRPI